MPYINYSKSENAAQAEEHGLFPASVVARKLKVPTKVVKDFGPSEWHHTSGWYNPTRYYNLEAIREFVGTDEGAAAVAAARAACETRTYYHNCTVQWLEWSGTRAHPSVHKMSAEGCKVVVKGVTATITFPSGLTIRKRLRTYGFSFVVEPPPVEPPPQAE